MLLTVSLLALLLQHAAYAAARGRTAGLSIEYFENPSYLTANQSSQVRTIPDITFRIMEAYRVGQLFPLEQYCTGREMNIAIPTESFFHLLMSLKKISSKEKRLFTTGKITAYLFEQRDIPFLIVDFGEEFRFDISFDTSKFDDETRRIWMASETNAIAIFLVEATTGILEGMLLIGIGFAPQLREICARQKGQTGIEERIRLIHSAFTTNDMIRHAVAKTVFK